MWDLTILMVLILRKKKIKTVIPLDGIPFHPYYTVKDLVGVVVFLIRVLLRDVLYSDNGRFVS